jgi:hypothetical protein
MSLVEAVVRHFCHGFRIPLLAGPELSGDESLAAASILRTVLAAGDARLVVATPLWLSLLDAPVVLGEGWSGEDRRRVAYLGEIGRCLGLLRGGAGIARAPDWPRRIAGLEPAAFPGRIDLFRSPAPPLPSSIFGDRWGVVEVLAFSDYAAFQRKYLDRLPGPVAA